MCDGISHGIHIFGRMECFNILYTARRGICGCSISRLPAWSEVLGGSPHGRKCWEVQVVGCVSPTRYTGFAAIATRFRVQGLGLRIED